MSIITKEKGEITLKNVYLVINNWSNERVRQVDIQNISVFHNYEDAKKCFEEKKNEIKSFDLGYDEITDDEDYYCESINGEYLYYHELVYIQKKEIK